MTRKDALACRLHQAVYDIGLKLLKDVGAAGKVEIFEAFLGQSGFSRAFSGGMEAALRWDYLQERWEEELDCELTLVTVSYFSEQARQDFPIDLTPEKYVTHGYGKVCAGWVMPKPELNAPIVVSTIDYRRRMVGGQRTALQRKARDAYRNGSNRVRKELKKQPLVPLLKKPV
jgi:hypothetical protein